MNARTEADEQAAATASGAFEPTRRQWVGYWCMIVQQTQNAFNDKAAQFVLIPLAAAVGFSLPLAGGADFGVESVAGLMIALPFVLFAPLAGWLSDRFSKRDVMLAMAVAQFCILCWICAAVWLAHLWMALAGFFALAVQSTVFSPAKIGINKELVGSSHLGFAAGIQQMMAMLAILIGQVAAGWIFDTRYVAAGALPEYAWLAAFGPLCLLTLLSLPAVALAWAVPRVPAQGHEPFAARLAVRHFRDLRELWKGVGLRRASFGVTFFWGFAAYLNLWSVKLAKEITGGGGGFGTLSSIYMASALIGMVLGFGTAAWLLRRRIELGWVPLAGAMMTVGSVALVFFDPRGVAFLGGLGGVAFASAVFLAPLSAWMQDNYPSHQRGELQSAVNLQTCLAGIFSVFIIAGLEIAARFAGMDPVAGLRAQLWVVAAACAGITVLVVRLLPRDFLRLLLLGVLRTLYRIRVSHPERVPESGGALLLPNHVTYADAFFLSAACRRPVRFVMDDVFMASPAIRLSARIFGTVPIRRDQPLEAIRAVINALNAGEVVCLFPEGQLSRTGALCELRRGFELIARKAGHPLVPVWCDGAWGSIFSFERGRFFRKIPYRIPYGLVVAFGRPLAPRAGTREAVRGAIYRASADAVARRFFVPGWGVRMPKATIPAGAWEMMRRCGEYQRRRFWINGHQIGQVDALPRRGEIHLLAGDPLIDALPPVVLTFAELHGSRVVMHDDLPATPGGVWVGGGFLRRKLTSHGALRALLFFDFEAADRTDEAVDAVVDVDGLVHLPCLAVDGVVVAMSMPHPCKPKPESEFQPGHKPGAFGMLLPGWICLPDETGRLRAHGPAAANGGLPLPANLRIDDGGFLAEC